MSPSRSIVNSLLPNFPTSTSTFHTPTATNTFASITPTIFVPTTDPWPSLEPELMDLMDAVDAYKESLESIDLMGWVKELDAIREEFEALRTPLAPARTSYASVIMDSKMVFIVFFVVLVVACAVVDWWVRGDFLKWGKGTEKDERRGSREGEEEEEEEDVQMIETAMEMGRKEGMEENESEVE